MFYVAQCLFEREEQAHVTSDIPTDIVFML